MNAVSQTQMSLHSRATMYNGYMPPAGPWALGMPVIPAPGGHAAAAQPPQADILFLKQDSSIFRQSSNPVCGFSVLEQVRLCAVWPTENWLGYSMNHIQGWKTV